MELLDRYLQVVRFWLPKGQKEDIAAELSEDIRSQIEEKEAELGRKLGEADLEAILERWGPPLRVAERYLPSRFLIGPALFPLYGLVLKAFLFGYLLPWLLVWASLVMIDPGYRAANPGFAQINNLWSWWLIAIHGFVAITVLFALAESSPAGLSFLEKWNPRERPSVDPNRISRSRSVGELAGSVVFMLWWLDVLRFPAIPGMRITLAPAWRSASGPILLFGLAVVAIAGVNLFRPWWTRRRSATCLAIDALGLVLTCFLLRAGPPWAELSAPHLPTPVVVTIANYSSWAALVALAVGLLLRGVQDARRIRRPSDTGPGTPGSSGSPRSGSSSW